MERPSGKSHLASCFWKCNGDVQIARWSRRMFFKNFRSSDGVGDACGVGVLAGVCPDAPDMPAMMIARSAAPRHGLKQIIADFEVIRYFRWF